MARADAERERQSRKRGGRAGMTTTEGAKPRLLLPGPNITQTVFIECGSMYRADGPVKMKPVGETKFVQWDRGNGCRGSQLARRWREGFEPLVPAQNGHRSETASCRVCQGTHSLNGSAFPDIREFGSSSPRQTGTAHFNRGETLPR
jgi:hypothetical protein